MKAEGEKGEIGYDFSRIEKKWQKYWDNNGTFRTPDFSKKPKFYVLDMFPYPSGNGLHVGHVEGYTATDITARYKRMQGFNVMHPMGWDAFGLPAEQYAIKTGTHPKITTKKNVDYFRSQIKGIGYSSDWSREVDTTDPKYYRWTQWIFLKLFERGLAYQSSQPVNWCPALGTVLANEEVIDGRSEVGGHLVERRSIRQWVLKITEYAERLLNDLDDLDWPESTKAMQRNWIGKSFGAEIEFAVANSQQKLRVFTTRSDTIFGVTFMSIAPEHKVLEAICGDKERKEVMSYVEAVKNKSELDRTSGGKGKTGVFTGAYVINPVNNEKVPLYVADYVLADYGTGCVMGVPGHDERDHEFAKKYGLKIVEVVKGDQPWDVQEAVYTGDGRIVNSDFLNGLNKDEAIEACCNWLEKKGAGKKTITYRLRDWIFSRQRYWGEPFPLMFDKDGNVHPMKEEDLPLTLPDMDDYSPTGSTEAPLSKVKNWLEVEKDGQEFLRETNIMPQWAGSCWYYLRYLDPHNDERGWDLEKEKYWMPVDLYVGGVEHANLHLLYARFWHKVLFDIGVVSTKEPFLKLRHQGTILGSNGEKMSKSRGNVVNPDDVIAEWGADSLRMYEMFMGPIEAAKPWQSQGISGIHRFLKRVWNLLVDSNGKLKVQDSVSQDLEVQYHRLIKKAHEDTEGWKFNTCIAGFMEFVNAVYKEESGLTRAMGEGLVLMLASYAPHIAEELWEIMGHKESLAYHPWPECDESKLGVTKMTLSVMVNGKMRSTLDVAVDVTEADAIRLAKELPAIEKHITGKPIVKEIYVAGKVVNLVVKG